MNCGGRTYSSSNQLLVTDLAGSAVPGTAIFNSGFAYAAADGSIYATTDVPTTRSDHNGLSFRADGALYIVSSAPGVTSVGQGGFLISDTGRVHVLSAGTPYSSNRGNQFTSTGRLVTN